MKKTILTITFTALALLTFAQGPQLAVQAGPILSTLSYDGESMNGVGYGGGISVSLPMTENWFFRPEINLQQRVLKEEYKDEGSSTYYAYSEEYLITNKLTFIDIPMLFEYRTGNNLGFYIGPQIGASIGTSLTANYSYSETNLSTGEEYKDEGVETYDSWYENFNEISMAAGVNYNLKNGLSFEFRAQRSVAAGEGFDNLETDMAFTNLQLGCRYTIPTRK